MDPNCCISRLTGLKAHPEKPTPSLRRDEEAGADGNNALLIGKNKHTLIHLPRSCRKKRSATTTSARASPAPAKNEPRMRAASKRRKLFAAPHQITVPKMQKT